MPDMTKYLFAGLEDAKKEREKREKSKAMKDLLSSVSTLFPDINAQSFNPTASSEPAPSTPAIPQGAPTPAPAGMPSAGVPAPPPGMFKTPEEAAKAFQAGQAAVSSGAVAPPQGAPPPGAPAPGVTAPAGQVGPAVTPGPGMLNLQPPPTAASPSAGPPRIPVPEAGSPEHAEATRVGKEALENATPDMRRQLLQMMANSGDYVPEAVDTIHKMFSGEPFKEEDKTFNHPPGSVVTDKKGKVLLTVPDRQQKPSFGVSPAGWLTTIYADGATQEHVGVKPMQTSVEALKQAGATLRGDAANEARIRAAEIAAQGGIDRVKMAGKYAKDLTRFKLDRKDAQDPKTVAAYYVKLLQSYQAGDATEEDITMMEYIRPIVEKQGLLPMLMQGGGELAPRTEPPWIDPPIPQEEPPEKKGVWDKLFGGKPEVNPAGSPVPEAIARTPRGPGKAPSAGPAAAAPAAGPGFSISGQKLTAPGGFSDADIQMTMDSMQRKLKEGYSKDQLVEHLRKKGWKVGR
jgi:hypothetical protein